MLTKKALAETTNLAAHTITRCENGETEPSDETVQSFAKATGFPEKFFYLSDIEEAEGASFRSLTSMTAGIRDASLSAGAIGFIVSDWIEERFNLPAVKVPDLSLYSPTVAARVLREEWSLGEKPVSNMVQLLESKGVRVFSLSEDTAKMNAFAIWRNERPFVYLNTFKSAESSRFDAAHELGHLVLHQDGACVGREAENEANAFAGSFLMPSSDVRAVLPRVRYLNQVLQQKKRWRVSAAALAYRLHKLEVITDWRYRDFCIEISKRNFNKNEPYPIARETSVVWKKILQSLWSERRTVSDIASDLYLPEREVNSLIYGLMGEVGSSSPAGDKTGVPIKLVE
tara:strand:+ start:380 stop:1408 length:1029 start_codon:yes stop_codon:yes gene_type:complete